VAVGGRVGVWVAVAVEVAVAVVVEVEVGVRVAAGAGEGVDVAVAATAAAATEVGESVVMALPATAGGVAVWLSGPPILSEVQATLASREMSRTREKTGCPGTIRQALAGFIG
jgi:hypothetical protein